MTILFRCVAVLAIAWAVLVPFYLVQRDLRDEQQRQLINLAIELRSTNSFVNWTNFAGQVSHLAEAEGNRSARHNKVVAISSACILVLSFCTFRLSRKRHEKDA